MTISSSLRQLLLGFLLAAIAISIPVSVSATQQSNPIIAGTKRLPILATFRNMPLIILPQIDSASRENLIRAYELERKEVRAPSVLGGTISLIKANESSLQLSTSSISHVVISLLPRKGKSPLIMLLQFVSDPIPDTQISFFTIDWTPMVEEDIIDLPQAEDFMPKTFVNEYAQQTLSGLLSPLFLRAEVSDTGDHLTFTTQIPVSIENIRLYETDIQTVQTTRISYHWDRDASKWIRI